MNSEDDEFERIEREIARRLAKQPAQQEPVAYLCENAVGHRYFRWKKPSGMYKPIALYTTPQPAQRTWVGLTDDERDDLLDTYITAEGRARAIEAQLKEKNKSGAKNA